MHMALARDTPARSSMAFPTSTTSPAEKFPWTAARTLRQIDRAAGLESCWPTIARDMPANGSLRSSIVHRRTTAITLARWASFRQSSRTEELEQLKTSRAGHLARESGHAAMPHHNRAPSEVFREDTPGAFCPAFASSHPSELQPASFSQRWLRCGSDGFGSSSSALRGRSVLRQYLVGGPRQQSPQCPTPRIGRAILEQKIGGGHDLRGWSQSQMGSGRGKTRIPVPARHKTVFLYFREPWGSTSVWSRQAFALWCAMRLTRWRSPPIGHNRPRLPVLTESIANVGLRELSAAAGRVSGNRPNRRRAAVPGIQRVWRAPWH